MKTAISWIAMRFFIEIRTFDIKKCKKNNSLKGGNAEGRWLVGWLFSAQWLISVMAQSTIRPFFLYYETPLIVSSGAAGPGKRALEQLL